MAINYQSSKEAAEKLAEELSSKYSIQAFALQADQGIEVDCERMVTDTIAKFGGIDIIVSNAVSFQLSLHALLFIFTVHSLTRNRVGQGSVQFQT